MADEKQYQVEYVITTLADPDVPDSKPVKTRSQVYAGAWIPWTQTSTPQELQEQAMARAAKEAATRTVRVLQGAGVLSKAASISSRTASRKV